MLCVLAIYFVRGFPALPCQVSLSFAVEMHFIKTSKDIVKSHRTEV